MSTTQITSTPPSAGPAAAAGRHRAPAATRPLRCRIGHHRWGAAVNPDGESYQRCVRANCGTDKGEPLTPISVSLPGNIALSATSR